MSQYNRKPTLKMPRFSMSAGFGGNIIVAAHDLVEMTGKLLREDWPFSFRPEPGDARARIEKRLQR